MGGGGKGGGNESSEALGAIANAFFTETTPLRQQLIGQYSEALQTGGSEARMPVIQKAQEQSRQATSNTLAGLDAQLAQSRLAGTPFGEQIRANALQQGQQATAAVPTNIVAQMFQQIPGFVTGANQTVVSGLGSAAGAEAQSAGANAGFLSAILSPFNFNWSG